jgi:hypothetical protein
MDKTDDDPQLSIKNSAWSLIVVVVTESMKINSMPSYFFQKENAEYLI